MDEDLFSPEGPDVLGPAHNCFICGQPLCFRTEPNCEDCGKKCFLGCGAKAPENCDRCVHVVRRQRPTGGNSMQPVWWRAIVSGAEDMNAKDATTILKNSGLNLTRVRDAAGGGKAGALAVKQAALVFGSRLWKVSREGGNVKEFYVIKQRPVLHHDPRTRTKRRGHPMSARAALAAVDALAKVRLGEPTYRDAPIEALTVAAELFEEAVDSETDVLVAATLTSELSKVRGLIVAKVRKRQTHVHGWEQSDIEALEKFARDEANKAIKRVLGRSRAAVEARRAKDRPKKKRERAAREALRVRIKVAKAKGTYKPRQTGDTKIHAKQKKKDRNHFRLLKKAYNKVERHGPGACSGLEVLRHAAHKARLEQRQASR